MEPKLQEMQAEIERLKIEVAGTSRALPVNSAMKDVTLVAGIKDWTGDSKGRSDFEFFTQIDTHAKVSNWTEEEKALVAKAKLQGIALQFVQGKELLASDACSFTALKESLTERFSEKLPAQYHYTRLQDATQEKGESVEEFADRCRRLCQKTVRNVADGATQRIINEEAERRLVAAYINGLGGVVGQQVMFRMPYSLEEAVQVAVTVSNAERMRVQDTKRVFSAKKDNSSQGVTCFNCGKRGHYARDCKAPKRDNNSRDGRTQNTNAGRRLAASNQALRSSSASGNPGGKQIRCFHCKKLGHRKDQCPQLMGNNTVPPNNQGSTARSPKSTLGPQVSH
jgi:hypothetical protein